MLCRSLSVTVFGKGPSMSRNSAETVLRVRQAFLTVASRRWSESVVERPGHPPKCVLGSRWFILMRWDMLSVMIVVSSLVVVFRSAMER